MKKIFLVIVLAVLTVTAMGQEKRKTFCQIVGTGKFLSAKVRVQIDFGQKRSYWNQHKNFMVDENGKRIEFYSMVDAMNYLAKFGWKFEQAYVITVDGAIRQNVYHWLLSKDIVSDDEIREGIITQKDLEDMEKAAMKNQENSNEEEKKVPLFMRNMKKESDEENEV